LSKPFPTFARWISWLGHPVLTISSWTSTPWWPADTLASKQRALLQLLSVAVAERLELAPLVRSFSEEHRGRYRRRLYRLSQRLAAGTSLPDALEQTPGVLTDEQMLAIRLGMQSGILSEVLPVLVDQQQSSSPVSHRLRQIGFYGTFLAILFFLVLSFILIKIVPSFQAIMFDFDIEGTEPLDFLIGISSAIVSTGLLLPLALLFCAWLILSEWSRRFFRRRMLSRIFRPVTQLRSANLLNLLAIAQQAGRPHPGTLSTLARYHYDSFIRNKLLFVRNEVEQGADLWKSLTQARLLSPAESRALTSSQTADSTVWTLRHLSAWKRNRIIRRCEIYVDFLVPAVIVLMAAVVLLTALATLTPLIKLTETLS